MSDGTDALARQILADARRQAEPLVTRARREAEELLRKAGQEAERRRELVRTRAQQRGEAAAQRVRARAELEAENIRRRAQEDILQQARQRAMVGLGEVAASDQHAEMLLRLALAGLAAMSGRRFEVVMRIQDREAHGEHIARALRDHAASELGRQVIVATADETITASGGLVVRRADGRQVCDQTFEARMDRLWPELRVEIAADLLGE